MHASLIRFGGLEFTGRVAAGDSDAIATLYQLLTAKYTGLLRSRLATDEGEDLLHECLLVVMETLRVGRLRDPHAFAGYIGAVIRRMIAGRIVSRIRQRRRLVASDDVVLTTAGRDPEAQVLRLESEAIFAEGLSGLNRRYYEILHRFYIEEQSCARICREMDLTDTQFRLLKSRAKAKLIAWVNKKSDRLPVNHRAAPVLEHLPSTAA